MFIIVQVLRKALWMVRRCLKPHTKPPYVSPSHSTSHISTSSSGERLNGSPLRESHAAYVQRMHMSTASYVQDTAGSDLVININKQKKEHPIDRTPRRGCTRFVCFLPPGCDATYRETISDGSTGIRAGTPGETICGRPRRISGSQ